MSNKNAIDAQTSISGSNTNPSDNPNNNKSKNNKLFLAGILILGLVIGAILGSFFGGSNEVVPQNLCTYQLLNKTNSSYINLADAVKIVAVNASYKEVNETIVTCASNLNATQIQYITKALNNT
jgi:predicted lipid-binding transport protein (Tim44 family)